MKQANNNEVDLLLRSLARGRDKSQSQSGLDSGNGTAAVSDHLDADELSSYAEGVVPAPARTRYMEHLAECDACRSIVIDLTQAAGVAGRFEVQREPKGSNFWQTLAALFSPAVLRFAVPALVLSAVIGIGWAVWLQRPGDFVARIKPAGVSPTSVEPAANEPALQTSTGPTSSPLPSGLQSATDSQGNREESKLQDEKTREAGATVTSTESTVGKATALKDSAQPAEDLDEATAQPYAPEPRPAAASPPPLALKRAEKSAELAKEESEKRDDQPRSRDAFKVPSDGEHGPNRSRSNTPPVATQRAASGVMGGRGPSADKNKKAGEDKVNEVEIRTVSGKRFARQESGWVDTDYEAPRATIKVTRGSDQFRALVADEPGIRAIANQLGGVVIIVWKNRAYRIE